MNKEENELSATNILSSISINRDKYLKRNIFIIIHIYIPTFFKDEYVSLCIDMNFEDDNLVLSNIKETDVLDNTSSFSKLYGTDNKELEKSEELSVFFGNGELSKKRGFISKDVFKSDSIDEILELIKGHIINSKDVVVSDLKINRIINNINLGIKNEWDEYRKTVKALKDFNMVKLKNELTNDLPKMDDLKKLNKI